MEEIEEDIDTIETKECVVVDVEQTPTEHVEELVPTWNLEWIEKMIDE